MDIRQLRYFVCIAQLGSLSAASHRLGIAQPSLSQHVKHLEEELGVELLVRSSRGVSVTESGQILLTHASRVLGALEAAVSDMRDQVGEPRGPVSVGLPSSACNVLSVPLAEAGRHMFPKILLRILDVMSGHVQQWLSEGSIDLGILYDVNEVRHLRVTPLLVEELFLVAAKKTWSEEVDANGVSCRSLSFSECAALELILPHRTHGLREMIERVAAAHSLHLNVIVEMDALVHLKTLVARGAGYSILAPAAVIREVEERRLVLVPIRDGLMRRTVYIVRNPQRVATRAALEIERLIIELTADLVRRGVWRGELVKRGKRFSADGQAAVSKYAAVP
jgi:LysR family transcriptional regulator, nitrogen assimilation regulatory protein